MIIFFEFIFNKLIRCNINTKKCFQNDSKFIVKKKCYICFENLII